MAVANSIAGVQAGARQVECTINGIGERAGNASLEEIVMALERAARRAALRHRHRHHPAGARPARRCRPSSASRVPPNKAIVGANAFAHEAGIHQDGMLKNQLTYEIMRPESVGAPGTRLVLGKHSGMRGLDARCRAIGHRLGQTELERVYLRGHGPRRPQQDRQRRAAGSDCPRGSRAAGRGLRWQRGGASRRDASGTGGRMALNIALLPGDGIGPEVTAEAVRLLKSVGEPLRPSLSR